MNDKDKKINCTLCNDWGLIERDNGRHIICPRCEIKRLDATIAELDVQIAECNANELLDAAFADENFAKQQREDCAKIIKSTQYRLKPGISEKTLQQADIEEKAAHILGPKINVALKKAPKNAVGVDLVSDAAKKIKQPTDNKIAPYDVAKSWAPKPYLGKVNDLVADKIDKNELGKKIEIEHKIMTAKDIVKAQQASLGKLSNAAKRRGRPKKNG